MLDLKPYDGAAGVCLIHGRKHMFTRLDGSDLHCSQCRFDARNPNQVDPAKAAMMLMERMNDKEGQKDA